jgi:hypothetical protein
MSKDLPDIGDTTIREEGTAFHWAALMVWLGHTVNVGTRAPNGVAIDDDMLDGIDEYLSFIRTWGGTPRLEFQVAAPRIHPLCGGTTDAWSFDICTSTLDVGDAKYGYRFVDPYECWQLLVYVCGLLDHLGIVDDTKITVRMHIFQPRAYRRGGPWFHWVVNASMLRAHFNILRMAAEQALSPVAKCATGPWCSNCAARLTCDAYDAAVDAAMQLIGEPISNDLTPARIDSELLRVSRAVEILEARQSALEAQAEHYMREGRQLKHYALQSGRTRAYWKAGMDDALRGIAAARNLKLFAEKPITPTQAKKFLDPAMVDALSDRPPGKLKVVRVDENKAARVFGQTSES